MVAVVLVLLLVVADVGLKSFAEGQVGREVQGSLELQEAPTVSLGGFPFLPRLISGSFPLVTLGVEGYEAADVVRVDSIRVDLRDVDIPRSQLISSGSGVIQAGGGDGTLRITGKDVTAAFQDQGIPLTIRFREGGIAASLEAFEGEVSADLELRGQSVFITPEFPIRVPYALELPQVVDGLTYTDLRVKGGALVVDFALSDVVIEVE
jgi:LmeA-like phospholipid-binding